MQRGPVHGRPPAEKKRRPEPKFGAFTLRCVARRQVASRGVAKRRAAWQPPPCVAPRAWQARRLHGVRGRSVLEDWRQGTWPSSGDVHPRGAPSIVDPGPTLHIHSKPTAETGAKVDRRTNRAPRWLGCPFQVLSGHRSEPHDEVVVLRGYDSRVRELRRRANPSGPASRESSAQRFACWTNTTFTGPLAVS